MNIDSIKDSAAQQMGYANFKDYWDYQMKAHSWTEEVQFREHYAEAFAQQLSMEFDVWKDKKFWLFSHRNYNGDVWYHNKHTRQDIKHSELWNIFISEREMK